MVGGAYINTIVNYLKKNLAKGYTSESLKWALINQGYSKTIIERAIIQVHKDLSKKAPVLREKPTIRYEIIDENNNPITIKKTFFRKVFDFLSNL